MDFPKTGVAVGTVWPAAPATPLFVCIRAPTAPAYTDGGWQLIGGGQVVEGPQGPPGADGAAGAQGAPGSAGVPGPPGAVAHTTVTVLPALAGKGLGDEVHLVGNGVFKVVASLTGTKMWWGLG